MSDQLSALQWSLIGAIALGGWTAFGWLARMVVRKITSGELVTRRESDGKDRENSHLRAVNTELIRQNSLLLGEALPTVAEALKGVRRAAEEKKQ